MLKLNKKEKEKYTNEQFEKSIKNYVQRRVSRFLRFERLWKRVREILIE